MVYTVNAFFIITWRSDKMENILIIIGIFISLVAFAAIFSSKKKKSERKYTRTESNNLSSAAINDLDVEYKGLKKEIVELIKDFNRTASYNSNVIDEKINYLSEVREDMDRRIVKLTKLLTDVEILHNRLEKTEVRLDQKFREVENNLDNLSTAINTEVRIQKDKENKYKEPTRYREYEHESNDLGKEFEEKIIRMVPRNNRLNSTEEQIFDFYDKGMSLKEIAEITGKGIGEIEFIMGLRRKR